MEDPMAILGADRLVSDDVHQYPVRRVRTEVTKNSLLNMQTVTNEILMSILDAQIAKLKRLRLIRENEKALQSMSENES